MSSSDKPRYCPYCGKEIDMSWEICPYCGKELPFTNSENGEIKTSSGSVNLPKEEKKNDAHIVGDKKENNGAGYYIPIEGYSSLNPIPTGLSLIDGEIVQWYGRRSFKSFIGSIITTAILFMLVVVPYIGWIFFFLGLILLLNIVFKWLGTEYTITNKRVYSRYGLISRKTAETTFDKITDISLSQGIWSRLLNYGDVLINTAGSLGYEIKFEGVSEPKYVEVKIRNISEVYKKQERIKERLERLEDRYLVGEITPAQYEEAKKKLENMIK